MTCECGICGACKGKKDKQACEARAQQEEADQQEYQACLKHQEETGERSLSPDKEDADHDDGDQD